MTHPTSQLADYVDGILQGAERERVESHLVSCDLCAAEVSDAVRGRDALSSLPQVEVPAGVTNPVLREVRGDVEPRQKSQEPKLKLRMGRLYGLAAASIAAVIALVFIVGGHDQATRSDAPMAAVAAPGTDMNRPDNEPGPLDMDGDYSASELSALAATEAQRRSGVPVSAADNQAAIGGNSVPTPSAEYAGAAPLPPLTASKSDVRKSMRKTTPVADPKKLQTCLRSVEAYANGGTLADSFEARYDGIPAYFAVLLEGPDQGQPPDKVVIWVLATDACDVVAFTQQRYPSAAPSPLPTTFIEP